MRGLLCILLLLCCSLASAETSSLAHQRAQSHRHLEKGKQRLANRQNAQAAFELALAHAYSPTPDLLIEVARACRRGGQDEEALAIALRMQQEFPALYRQELDEMIQILRLKLADLEVDSAQILRSRLDDARQKFQAAAYEEAVHQYAIAHAIKPLPRLLFNMAQAYRRARQAKPAYLLYSRYVEQEPETPLKKEVETSLDELRAAAFPPPLYRRAWFWGVMASIAVTGVAIGVGLGLGLRENPLVLRFDIP